MRIIRSHLAIRQLRFEYAVVIIKKHEKGAK